MWIVGHTHKINIETYKMKDQSNIRSWIKMKHNWYIYGRVINFESRDVSYHYHFIRSALYTCTCTLDLRHRTATLLFYYTKSRNISPILQIRMSQFSFRGALSLITFIGCWIRFNLQSSRIELTSMIFNLLKKKNLAHLWQHQYSNILMMLY